MPIERLFLGWDGPCLPRAAAWLRDRYTTNNTRDMTGVLVVTAGATAGKRLLEILIDAAGDTLFFPPAFLTPGSLPEQLYEPSKPIADDLQSLLARVHALRTADKDVLANVVTEPPEKGDLQGWLALARDLASVHESLAAGAVRTRDVPALCSSIADFNEEERWQAIDELQRGYEKSLESRGLQDRHTARFDALARKACAAAGDIILVAATDLDRLAHRILTQAGDRIWALVHAPESEAENFDALGCFIPEKWADRQLDLDPSIVRVLDQPRDQAYEVLRTLDGDLAGGLNGKYAADEITVGVGDDAIASLVERTLDFAGVPVRTCVGRPIAQTAPALLLDGLAKYFGGERFDELAGLLRHPDIETYLGQTLDQGSTGPAVADWLTLLDRYITEHLQGTSTNKWLGDPKRAARLKAVYDAIHALVPPDFAKAKPLPLWSAPIAAALERVYGTRSLDRKDAGDLSVIRTLSIIGDALRDQALLPADDETTPRVNLGEAITFTLARVADQVILPELGQTAAVEMQRWLDLQLDDAPALIITGVNEGRIPESVVTDTFLPDHVRRTMGLTDNRRRYARDMMMLTAILNSRPDVRLLTGRRSTDEDPLTPSRLLLACDEEILPRRVLEFYGDKSDEAPREPAPLLPHGKANRFAMPRPPVPLVLPAKPLTALRVTAFRDYIACPYRFYLRHVLKLEAFDDHATELDGAAFGNLAHEAMQAFGQSDLADSTDTDTIAKFLSHTLDQLARRNFGASAPPAVLIQIEQLRYRLQAMARWQAAQNAEGWCMMPQKIEAGFKAEIDVDGEPFTITGRIDRIDSHPEKGTRILDYKTSDSAKKPESVHRFNDEWTDLQLPLYATLASSLDLPKPVALGFVQLPKDTTKIGLSLATWRPEQLADALEKAKEIIRKVRRAEFWPPKEPPPFIDEFGRVCMDACLDREAAISLGDKKERRSP